MQASKWMVTVVLLGSSFAMKAQNNTMKDDLFTDTEKFAKNATSVTEINQDPDSLTMVNGPNSSRAHRTLLNVVHTYSYDKPGMYNMADVDAIRARLNTGDWHCSVHTREIKTGESTDVCQKRRSDGLSETAIVTVEPKELTFIHTIRRSAPGQPGGGDSFLSMPLDMSGVEGMPSQAWAAELRAEMAATRAEMAAVRPEMMRDLAGMQTYINGSLMTMPRIEPLTGEQLKALRDLQRHPPTLNTSPKLKHFDRSIGSSAPQVPAPPAVPTPPSPAAVPPPPVPDASAVPAPPAVASFPASNV